MKGVTVTHAINPYPGNRCGGDVLYRGLLQHLLANRIVVYPSQGGRYCSKDCVSLGS
jgi:hypothetical protein